MELSWKTEEFGIPHARLYWKHRQLMTCLCILAVQVQRDESEFARLSNLGDILGLTPMDINAVHTGLAEQAFRHQVQMVRFLNYLR